MSIIASGFDIIALEKKDLTGVEPVRLTGELLDEFEAYVVDAMERFDIPGSSVYVVQGGEIVYANGFGVHKRGKWITKSEATEVLALLDRGKSKNAVARETGIGRSKVYQLWNEKLARDADEQAIQQREEEDRKRPCLQHVFIREIVKEDFPLKPKGAPSAQKRTHIDRCRLCGFEKRQPPRFFQMDWQSDLPGKTGAETPSISESSSAG